MASDNGLYRQRRFRAHGHEARSLRREIVRRIERTQQREIRPQAGCIELEQSLRLPDILQAMRTEIVERGALRKTLAYQLGGGPGRDDLSSVPRIAR